MKQIKVACPLVKYAYEENGKVVAWNINEEKLLEFLEKKEKKEKGMTG